MVLYSVHPACVLCLRMPLLAKAQFDKLLCQKVVFVCPSLQSVHFGSCEKLDQITFLEDVSPSVTFTEPNNPTPIITTLKTETNETDTDEVVDGEVVDDEVVNDEFVDNKTESEETDATNDDVTDKASKIGADETTNVTAESSTNQTETTTSKNEPSTTKPEKEIPQSTSTINSNNNNNNNSTNANQQQSTETKKGTKQENNEAKNKTLEISVRSCKSLRDDFFQYLPTSSFISLNLYLEEQNFVHTTIALNNLTSLEISECEMVWVNIFSTSLQTLVLEQLKFTTLNYDVPNVKDFSMTNCPTIPRDFSKFPYVKHITFAEIRAPRQLEIITSGNCLPFLEELRMFYMKSMNELTIDSNTLTNLTVSHCAPLVVMHVHSHTLKSITLERNAWLQDLSLRCPELLSLSMPSCNRVSEKSISQMILPRVRYMNLRRVVGATYHQIRKFPEKFPNVRAVRLVDVVNPSAVKRILKALCGQTSLDPPPYNPFTDTTPDRSLENINQVRDTCDMEPPDLVSDSDYEDF